MKTTTQMKAVHVISEPGDCTRYDYSYYQHDDNFYFISIGNDFNYPKILNYHEIKDIKEIDKNVMTICNNFNCNPHIVMECIRTIKEVMQEVKP